MARTYGVRFVIYDWEGYGASDGSPSERAMKRAADAVLCYVEEQFRGSTIISWGRSIGSVSACYLAAT